MHTERNNRWSVEQEREIDQGLLRACDSDVRLDVEGGSQLGGTLVNPGEPAACLRTV